jgi:type II secretory pathway pseudopilin PulG
MNGTGQAGSRSDGYAMAALLVALGVMAVAISMLLPVWRQQVQREKEEELIFRGRQYARAVELFQRRYRGASPPDVDVLVDQKFLRKKYQDPMVEDGEFEILYQGSAGAGQRGANRTVTLPGQTSASGGTVSVSVRFDSRSGTVTQVGPGGAAGPRGVIGVRSKSEETSLRIYNGGTHYDEWLFVFIPRTTGAGGRGGQGGRGEQGVGPGGMQRGRGGQGMRPGDTQGGRGGGGQRGGRGGQGSGRQGPTGRGGRGQD